MIGFISSSFNSLLYSLLREYGFSVAFGVMYLYILELRYPSALGIFEFTGIYDTDLLVSRNLIVLFRIDLELNLLVVDLVPSSSVPSPILDPPIILFLNYDRTSFLCLLYFFVLVSSGSNSPFL